MNNTTTTDTNQARHHDFTSGAEVWSTQRRVLTNDELRSSVPAVFSQGRSFETTTDKYSFVPTIRVIDALRDSGFEVVAGKQVGGRVGNRNEHNPHEVRLRMAGGDSNNYRVGDTFPEVLLRNSHNGGCSFKATFGMFRFVCSNGLIVSDSTIASRSVRHIGLEFNEVIDAVEQVWQQGYQVMSKIEEWTKIQVTEKQESELAARGCAARWGGVTDSPFMDLQDARQHLLSPRRSSDRSKDLYTVFNVLQENVIRGGQSVENAIGKTRKIRRVDSIDTDRRINQRLWEAAECISAAPRAN